MSAGLPLTGWAAACCRCHDAGDKVNTTCIQTDTVTQGQCDSLPQNTKNSDLQSAVCEETPNCTSISEGKGGTCLKGPLPEAQFKTTPAPGLTSDLTAEPITMNVPIPGLQFSAGKVVGDFVEIPILAQYIVAVYKFLLGISAVAAAIMIMYGGFKYILASTGAGVKEGQTAIRDALIGLVLLIGTYTILQTVNPEALALNALKIRIIRPPEEAYFAANGTGDPFYSAGAADRAARDPVQGDAPALSPADLVDISSIPFDKSLGGPENLKNYCSSKAEAQAATTYDQKIKLLVRAVLGWQKTCIDNKLCVYCQACTTSIPSGMINGNPAPNYVAENAIRLHIDEGLPENMWARQPECVDAWNKTGAYEKTGGHYVVNGIPECAGPAKEIYQKYFIDTFMKEKLYGGDCGSFAMELYRCAGAAFKEPPKEAAFDNRSKKTVNTIYLSEKSLGAHDDEPASILSAHMNENLLALAAKKGGMKFGDLVYTCCGGTGSYNAHWFLYTGGRPDVPFSFIEMGGGSGVNVPNLGGVSGVHTRPKEWTIQDYINTKIKGRQLLSKSGKVIQTYKPDYDGAKGLVFVWRPYEE